MATKTGARQEIDIAKVAVMPQWEELHIRLSGATPLLMHNPAQMRRGDVLGKKEIPTPEAEAEAGLYRLPSGVLYVKADHVRESMKAGSAGYRISKKAARPQLAGGVLEHPDHPFFPLYRHGEAITEYEIDTRRAVVQRQGILRSRPLIEVPWECEAVLLYDKAVLGGPEIIVTVLAKAGQVVGLLDYRPQKGGPFGRFNVESAWTE